MDTISGFPFYRLEMTKIGTVFKKAEQTAIVAAVNATGAERITDLFVVSHGWNNDMAEARQLYDDLFKSAAKLLTAFRKENEQRPLVKGGLYEGAPVDEALVKKLAALPTREEALGQFLGALNSVLVMFALALEARKTQLEAGDTGQAA